jgi:hypothetical protein
MSFNFPNCQREPRKRFVTKNIDRNRVLVATSRLRFGESSDDGGERLSLSFGLGCKLSNSLGRILFHRRRYIDGVSSVKVSVDPRKARLLIPNQAENADFERWPLTDRIAEN